MAPPLSAPVRLRRALGSLLSPALLWPTAGLLSCGDPTLPAPSGVGSPTVTGVRSTPVRSDGLVSPVTRLTLDTTPELGQLDAVVLVAGGADASEIAALAKSRVTSALRARIVATTHWFDGSLVVQPSAVLPAGRATLVVMPTRRAPLAVELEVAGEAVPPTQLARRVWTSATRITFCGSAASVLPELPPTLPLARPEGVAQVRAIAGVPCFDVTAPAEGQVLPPEVTGWLLDPAPQPIERAAPSLSACPAAAIALDGLCLRVEDDRLVLHGDPDAPRLLLGSIGGRPWLERLAPGARRVVRPLLPESDVRIDLELRDGAGERRLTRVLTTRPRRRHPVLNEVLVRPPSGAASQRFVELANDSDVAIDLAGLRLVDGSRTLVLPPGMLAAGGYALITPAGYVDGLAGEVAPPRGPLRITVDRLGLAAGLTLVEPDGTVLSRFPPTSSTRSTARGRRTPEHPDDAPDAFGWDRQGRATPGRENALE